MPGVIRPFQCDRQEWWPGEKGGRATNTFLSARQLQPMRGKLFKSCEVDILPPVQGAVRRWSTTRRQRALTFDQLPSRGRTSGGKLRALASQAEAFRSIRSCRRCRGRRARLRDQRMSGVIVRRALRESWASTRDRKSGEMPDVKDRSRLGSKRGDTPDQFDDSSEIAKWGKVVREARIC